MRALLGIYEWFPIIGILVGLAAVVCFFLTWYNVHQIKDMMYRRELAEKEAAKAARDAIAAVKSASAASPKP